MLCSNVRVIAATNRNLLEAMAQGRFRSDLYYRLAAITIELPPLRRRVDDIKAIAQNYMEELNRRFAGNGCYQPHQLSPEAMHFLENYEWPGNIRQLQNALKQAAVFSGSEIIELEEIKAAIIELPSDGPDPILQRSLGEGFEIDALLDKVQSHYFQRALEQTGGNQTRAAELLGLKQQTFNNRMKRWEEGKTG